MQLLVQSPLFCRQCGCAHARGEASCAQCGADLPALRTEIIPIPRSLGHSFDAAAPERSRARVKHVLISCAGLALLSLLGVALRDLERRPNSHAPVSATPTASRQSSPTPAPVQPTKPAVVNLPKESFKISPDGAVIIKADLLYQTYEGDEDKADAWFKGRTLEVSGTVDHLGKYLLGKTYVSLKSKSNPSLGVRCFFNDEQQEALAGLEPGQAVTIRGKCGGKAGNIILEDCTLR